MEIEYNDAKRLLILEDRKLDIARSDEVFADFHLSRRDDKHSTPEEERFNALGMLDDDIVIVVWTPRGARRRIVTMWKANERERENYQRQRDRPG